MRKELALVAALGLLTTACQSGAGYGNNPNTYKGAGIGAAVGGAAGALGGDNDRQSWKRGAIGAGIGALAGAGIGQYMDSQETEMRQELAGTGVEVKRQGDDILLNMPNSITFDFDSSRVKTQFNGTVSDIARILNQYPQTNIEVAGHTDNVGTDSYNQKLSEQRAQAVVTKLISSGVAANRLYHFGRGETQPIASNNTENGRAQNRRVEIKISPIQ